MLIRVPYEVYEVHVNRFPRIAFSGFYRPIWRMPVGTSVPSASFATTFATPSKASECDHLSRLAWLNQGSGIACSNGITSTAELTEAVTTADDRWQSVIDSATGCGRMGQR